MTKRKIKYYLDFIPLIILLFSAIILVAEMNNANSFFLWKQILGLIILVANTILFFWRHQIAVLALGFTLILGLVGGIALTYNISITTLYVGKDGFFIPVFYGQPIFLLWLIIHFVVSARYYFGILTGKYWQALLSENRQGISR